MNLLLYQRGVEHKPVADKEVWVLLFEPIEILNTGNTAGAFTKEKLDTI